jgi:hypothetical protein
MVSLAPSPAATIIRACSRTFAALKTNALCRMNHMPTKEADAYCPPGSPLPNVAHDRGHGITAIRVYCEGLYCPHSRVFSFEELKVPDELPVIHIPRIRRFVCTKCGSRKVQVRSEWPERKSGSTFYSPAFEATIRKPS